MRVCQRCNDPWHALSYYVVVAACNSVQWSAALPVCCWSSPAEPSSLLRIRSALLLNTLAHTQVLYDSDRVLRRTLQDPANRTDTLTVERVLRCQPTKMDESVAHLRFLNGIQWEHRFGL